MKKQLALLFLLALATTPSYAKIEKNLDFDETSTYIYRGTFNGMLMVDEYKSTLPLGVMGTHALLSFLPDAYSLGLGYKVSSWQIGGATMAFDAINFGIRAMNPEIIRAGLEIAKDSVDADLVATWFIQTAHNKMASARTSVATSGLFAALAYKYQNYAAPMLNELTSKLFGNWLNKYGFLSTSLFETCDNPYGTIIKNASEQGIRLKSDFSLIPAALLALNTLRTYQGSEALRGAIVEIATILINSDKTGLAARPDLIEAMNKACQNALSDSLVARWSANKQLQKTITNTKAVKLA